TTNGRPVERAKVVAEQVVRSPPSPAIEALQQLVGIGVRATNRGHSANRISGRGYFHVRACRRVETVGCSDEGGEVSIFLLSGCEYLCSEISVPANGPERIEDYEISVTIGASNWRNRVAAGEGA